MVLEFHPEVKEEVQAAFDWYEARSTGLGERFLKELDLSFEDILSRPEVHQVHINGIRRCLVRKFPFGILFTENPDHIFILAVMHLKRRPFFWMERVQP
jgi:hypothetical protein